MFCECLDNRSALAASGLGQLLSQLLNALPQSSNLWINPAQVREQRPIGQGAWGWFSGIWGVCIVDDCRRRWQDYVGYGLRFR